MNSLILHKPVSFSHFTEHYLFVKNCPMVQMNSLIEELSGILYENQISLVHGLISAPEYGFKQWNQMIDEQFDEPNWPIIWINNDAQNETCTGYFYGLSGISILTLQSDFYLSKLFTTKDARFLFCGRIVAENQHADLKQQHQEIIQHQQTALQFSEMNENHKIQTWHYFSELGQEELSVPDSMNDSGLVNSISGVSTPYNPAMVSCICAVLPLNKNLKMANLESNEHFSGLEIRDEKHSKLHVLGRFSPDQKELFIKRLELFLEKNMYSWQNLVRGIFWMPEGYNPRELKDLLKSFKIPVYPQLMLERKHTVITWEADFVK